MAKLSAGLIPYRFHKGELQIFLVHMGGPFWKNKEKHSWSIPKGELEQGEEPLSAARREFREETGFDAPNGPFVRMTPLRQPSGKSVHAWAFEGDFDPEALQSNTFLLEWPPRSGKRQEFPEVDRAGWFPLEKACEKLVRGQTGFIEELVQKLGIR